MKSMDVDMPSDLLQAFIMLQFRVHGFAQYNWRIGA